MTVRRGLVLLAVTLAVAAGAVTGWATPASAHAVVISSTPTDGQTVATAPTEVQISFSEDISADENGLTVLDSSGERVDNGDTQVTATVLSTSLKPDLPDGTYVMNYHAVSADGHPVSAAIVFGVGDGTVIDTTGVAGLQAGKDPGFEVAAGIARFITYAGAMLAAGLAFFVTFLHDQREDRWRLTPVVRISAVIGGLGAIATVALQAALLSGDGFSAMTDVSTLRRALTEGLDWATVLVLAGLAMVHLSTDVSKAVAAQSLAFYGGLVTVASFAFWGHSTTADPRWLLFLADVTHVACGAIWFGGLVGLTMTLWIRRRSPELTEPVAELTAARVGVGPDRAEHDDNVSVLPEPEDGRTAETGPASADDLATSTARIVSRFSTVAALCLVLLVVAGVTLGWKELGGLSGIGSSAYGRALLVKVGLVLVILVGASYNRFVLLPAIAEDAADTDDDDVEFRPAARRETWRKLDRSLAAEAIGIVVVLGVTSVLVNLTPPRSAAATDVTDAVQTKPVNGTDAQVEVALVPTKVGNNSVHITYSNSSYQPIDVAQQVSVELTQPAQGIGPISRDATKAATGHFIIDTMQIPTAGAWKLTLITRVSDFEQVRTDFTYNVTS